MAFLYQRTKVREQTAVLNFGEPQVSRWVWRRSTYLEHRWLGCKLADTAVVVLMNCWELSIHKHESEKYWDHSIREAPPRTPPGSQSADLRNLLENSVRARGSLVKYTQCFYITKPVLQGKDCPEVLSIRRKGRKEKWTIPDSKV